MEQYKQQVRCGTLWECHQTKPMPAGSALYYKKFQHMNFLYLKCYYLQRFLLSQSDKLQEQQDLIAELQCHLSTPGLLGLGLNLSSRPHTAPMGSMQHGPNGGMYRQVTSQLV